MDSPKANFQLLRITASAKGFVKPAQDKAREDGNAERSAARADQHDAEDFGAQMRAAAEARRRDLGGNPKEASPFPETCWLPLPVLSIKALL